MKTLNTQTVAKPGFTKSKAFGLCGTLALATALLIGAGQVSADETTQPVADTQPAVSNVYTADNTVGETPKVLAPAPVESQPIAETPATTTEAAQPVAETPAAPTSVVKDGDTITVENPNVEVTFPNGTGKYSPLEVEYKDVEFPDSMAINEGDKVVTELPKEIGLQTSFDFDVYNNENVVGKANADAQTRKITTTFNNYFTSHPLNKKMSLKFDAKWLDVVEPGKPVTVNFNGTVKTFTIGEEGPLPSDEVVSKWGSQDKTDPTTINWTVRLNLAKLNLTNATIRDRLSENQTYIEGSENMYFVDDVQNWSGIDMSAKDYLDSWHVQSGGFDAKFKEFNKTLYIDYKAKLKEAVKDSTNPVNKVKFTYNDAEKTYTSRVQLVGGRGDASGENKPEPTFEIPREAPKVDIPEFEGGIPGIPEVRELPEYTEPIGTVPNDAPKYEKPEFKGGVVPNDPPVVEIPEYNEPIGTVPNEAPIHDKPEFEGGIPGIPEERELPPFEGGVIPNDAPILDLPELEIPAEPEKPTTPKEVPNKPVDAPKEKAAAQSTTVSYNLAPVSKEAPKTTVYGGVLPNTGEKDGIMSTLGLVVIAAGIASLTLTFKKYNEGEEE